MVAAAVVADPALFLLPAGQTAARRAVDLLIEQCVPRPG